VKKSDKKKPAKAVAPVQKPAPKAPAGKSSAKASPKLSAKPAASRIDAEMLRQLAAVLNETGLTEIEYDSNGLRVRVARHAGGAVMSAAPAYAPASAGEVSAPAPVKALDPASHPGTVKSPMVGVFYLLPEPGASPFIKLGDSVTEGQTLGLIEAMKTFNPVKAPRGGKVTKILVESGSPVEYGEPLVIIE